MKAISRLITPCLGFLLITAVHLRAATITVTNTADSGVGTLRAALASANNGDTINFALPLPSTVVVSGGNLAVNKRVAILGPGPTNLIVQGGGSSELFYLSAPTNNNIITIAGLTIANGFTTYNGAGIYNNACNLTVSNVVLTGNTAFGGGGGIFNDGSYASVTLTVVNSIISSNSAGTGASGAGIFSSSQNTNNASVVISNCTIVGNESGDVGGGIANAAASGGTANFTVLNSTLIDNSASSGAGIWNGEVDATGEANLSITNSTLSGNSADSGAGIENVNGSVTVSDSVVSSNVANNNCGGVYNVAHDPGKAATAQIIRSTVSGNSVLSTGGGIRNLSYNQGTVKLTVLDSTLADNSAGGDGGGIQNDNTADATAILGITNSTFSGNSSAIGGGIENLKGSSGTSTVWIANCTLSGDTAPAGSGIYNQRGTVQFGSTILNETNSVAVSNYLGSVISLGYNLCRDNGGGFLTNATDQINTAPLLGPLQDNGGPTFTRAPLPGSPAIDKGKDFSGSATDQRGMQRTFDKAAIPNAAGGDGTDIGAVESQSYSVVNTNDSGTGSLRQAIADSNAQPGTNTIDFAPSAYGTILLTSGELLITNNVFIAGPGATNEMVDGNRKDRIFHIGSNAVPIIATVSGLTLTNGSHPGFPPPGDGGAIFSDSANLTVSNCFAVFNLAANGGAIANFGLSRTGAVFRVVNSMFTSNNANYGGAVWNGGLAMAEIRNATFKGNGTGQGAAISNIGRNNSSGSGLLIVNSTFSDASGYEDVFIASGVSVSVLNSTFVETNSSVALYLDSGSNNLQIGSTILASDRYTSAIVAVLGGGTTVTSTGFNIASGSANGFLTNITDQINTDPMLGPLQNNGGPTFTQAPLPGSPAIDAGKNFSGSATDQRGFARTLNIAGVPNSAGGDGTDIGAVEFQDASLRLVNPGVVGNQFGFNLTGPFANVVVEASTNLTGASWLPLSTNVLGDAPLHFTEPTAPTLLKRFYRARVQ
jgi:hypothetical protein